MRARILEAHPAPPGNGAWRAEAIIDVEIQLAGIELIVRGITVRSKPSEGKTFFGMKSFKRDEDWVQIVDFPSHNKEVQSALLEAWNTWNTSKQQTESNQPAQIDALMRFAAVDLELAQKQSAPKPNRALLEECPF